VRKTGFKEHPGVIPDLDLVEADDQFTHQLDIEEEMLGE
jgi:pre-mRNA-splicing factor CWC22